MQAAIYEDEARVLELLCVPEAVHAARDLVGNYFGAESDLPKLAVSELVGNAVRHASVNGIGRFKVLLYPPDAQGRACIEVYDCSTQPPILDVELDDEHLFEEGGRGLALLRGYGVELLYLTYYQGWAKVVRAFVPLEGAS